jgi:hypothetical protein
MYKIIEEIFVYLALRYVRVGEGVESWHDGSNSTSHHVDKQLSFHVSRGSVQRLMLAVILFLQCYTVSSYNKVWYSVSAVNSLKHSGNCVYHLFYIVTNWGVAWRHVPGWVTWIILRRGLRLFTGLIRYWRFQPWRVTIATEYKHRLQQLLLFNRCDCKCN